MSLISEFLLTNPFKFLKNDAVKKNLLNSVYYFGGTILQFIVAIFTQPVFSRYLELKDFALIGYFSAVQALIYPLFSMTLPFYYMANYWKTSEKSLNDSSLSLILNFLNLSNGLVAVVSFVLLNLYFKSFQVSFPLMPFIFIVFINLFFEKYRTFYLLECRIRKKGLQFLLLNILQIAANTSFSLFFVISLRGGAVGRMSGILLGVVFTGLVSIFFFLRNSKFKFSLKIDIKVIKPALKYCIPLIIAAYAYYPIGNIDRIFLERLGDVSEFGYYNIGLIISGFAGTFFLALYQSFEPDLYKLITQKRYKQYLLFVFFYLIVLAGLSLIFILVSHSIVSFLTAGRFVKASVYANVFIIGIFFMQTGGIFEQLFTAFGATKLVMWRNIMMGVFCIAMYYFMIEKYQFHGANITRVITSIFYVFSGAVLFAFYMRSQRSDAKTSEMMSM